MRLPNCSKLAVDWKNSNYVTIFYMTSSSNFFWLCFVSLVKFKYWSKFHVNIITGSGIMIILFCKGLTRNPEIGNTSVWVLATIWRLGQLGNIKFGTKIYNKILLNAAKSQGGSFYRFWVTEENQQGVKLPPLPPSTHIHTHT